MTRKRLTDAELDSLLVRTLSRLHGQGPSRGFGQRVLARVRLPQPYPVRLARRARAWVCEPRRAFALAGGYAAAATVALAFAVPWLAAHVTAIDVGFNWVTAQALSAMRALAYAAAQWAVASGVTRFLENVPLRGASLWLAGSLLTACYVACAVGLRILLRAPRTNNVAVRVDA